MNISDLTAGRLKSRDEQIQLAKQKQPTEEPTPEPVLDIKEFFKESINEGGKTLLTSSERYALFLSENNIIDGEFSPENYEVYGTIALSDMFRSIKHNLNEQQVSAFSGIENVRAYLDSSNCNCQTKKAKLEEYYKDFVLGNASSDLFPSMKKGSNVKKITFYYENEIILEV